MSAPLLESGQVEEQISLNMSKLSYTYTCTSKIITSALNVGQTSCKYAMPSSQKSKHFVFFKGHPHQVDEGDNWCRVLLQYPADQDSQFVPPILFLR